MRASGKNTFEDNGSGERYPVVNPSASAVNEVFSLRRVVEAGADVCNVVRAAYDTGLSHGKIVTVEVVADGICVARS